jgi:hypothetical protein
VKYNSVSEYIYKTHYNYLFDEINRHFLKVRKQLDLGTKSIPNPTHAKLEDFSIEAVYYKDDIFQEKDEIKLSVNVEITLSGDKFNDFENDTKNIWFIVTCHAKIKNGISDFEINEVEEYITKPYKYLESLSPFAIPYISNDDLDDRAKMFLEKYCKEALESPMALPIKTVLNNMAVRAYYAPLGNDVYGKTFFSKSVEEVYDKNHEKVKMELGPRTILVNRNIQDVDVFGSINNTIIHECVHIEFHTKYFELHKITSNSSNSIIYKAKQQNEKLNSDEQRAFDFMEWQASKLTPRILMPAQTTKIKFHQLRDEICNQFPLYNDADKLQIVIERLAEFYKVSKQAAKIRLIDLGFHKALGVNNYVNGEKVPNFSQNTKQLNRNQTFVIDFLDSVIHTSTNEILSKLSREGKITYVNGIVVINAPKFVSINNQGQKELTSYALEHLDECAFVFSKRQNNTQSEQNNYVMSMNFLCRPQNKKDYVPTDYATESPNNKELERFADEIDDSFEALTLKKRMNGKFYEDFNEVIKELGFVKADGTPNSYQISKHTNVSDKTITSYLTEGSKPSKEILLAICAGLKIHSIIAYVLFEKAGISIRNSYDPDDVIYCNLIDMHHDEGLERWNKYLEDANKNQLP